ncbi:tonB-dependent Receptor Plug domain protein, partial [Vibrio parahaemolyticus AQ3810]
KTLRTSMKA